MIERKRERKREERKMMEKGNDFSRNRFLMIDKDN